MILLQIKVSLKFNEDTLDADMRDWLIIGCYAGLRLSEWVQEQKLVNKGMLSSMTLLREGMALPRHLP
eukprot:15331239-Ditylum_brightwellii.AAC.2